jgi:hypothetical protein
MQLSDMRVQIIRLSPSGTAGWMANHVGRASVRVVREAACRSAPRAAQGEPLSVDAYEDAERRMRATRAAPSVGVLRARIGRSEPQDRRM